MCSNAPGDLKQASRGTRNRRWNATKPLQFSIYMHIAQHLGELRSWLASLLLCVFTDRACLCIFKCERLQQLDRSWQIRAASRLKPLYLESHGTWREQLLFYLRLMLSSSTFIYSSIAAADIMRTWVSNEMKWGKTRPLPAPFSGQLLKTAGVTRLTGPLT